jgi:site-specific recombinase XerD
LIFIVLLNRCGGRLSAREVHNILGALAGHVTLSAPVTGSVLRHSFGTDLLRQGQNLVLLVGLEVPEES